MRKAMDEWTLRNPAVATVKFVQSEFLVNNPKVPKVEEDGSRERVKMGLSPCPTDISPSKSPSLAYINDPPNKTRGDFLNRLRRQNVRPALTIDGGHVQVRLQPPQGRGGAAADEGERRSSECDRS